MYQKREAEKTTHRRHLQHVKIERESNACLFESQSWTLRDKEDER